MLKQKYKFYWVSPRGKGTRRHEVPALAVYALLVMAVIGTIGAVPVAIHYAYEYRGLRNEVTDVHELRERNQNHRIQLQNFAHRVSYLEDEMARIRSFNTKLRVLANLQFTDEGRESEILGVGGPSNDTAELTRLLDREIESQVQKMHMRLEDLRMETRLQRESIAELQEFLADKASILASTPSIWPVKGWVSSRYGLRVSSFSGQREFHRGLDIAARTGTQIKAPADAIVTKARRWGGYGKVVVLDHGYGTETRYGHLSRIHVKVGDKVKRGDLIGAVGTTGRSTGPHLHYEVRLAGKTVDPMKYILN